MEEQKNAVSTQALEAEDLGLVTGGAAWMDDPEAIDNFRKKEDVPADGIAAEPVKGTDPVAGAGALDRLALGMDRVREGLTKAATRK